MNLPREILKWIHGLDLSYSITNPARDLDNGFLVAEIFTRYFPSKIQMFSLENSHNKEFRKNNWSIIEKFIKKQDLEIKEIDYNLLVEGDRQKLKDFIVIMYETLTKKKIMTPPLQSLFQTGNYAVQDTKNNSFILKETGLELIDDKKQLENIEQQQQQSQIQNESIMSDKTLKTKSKAFVRNVQRPIAEKVEQNVQYHVEVKSVSIRSVNIPVNKLKDRSNMQYIPLMENMSEKNQDQEMSKNLLNKQNTNIVNDSQQPSIKEKANKTVFDLLDKIMSKQLNSPLFEADLQTISNFNCSQIQVLMDYLNLFSDEFISAILQEMKEKHDFILKYIFKDPNEIWKYIYFLINLIKQIDFQKDQFNDIYDLIKTMTEKSIEHGTVISISTKNIFNDYFQNVLLNLITQNSNQLRNKKLIEIIYFFNQNDANSRNNLLNDIRKKTNSRTLCYFIYVCLLQESKINENNEKFIEQGFYFAQVSLFSSSPEERSNATEILRHLMNLDSQKVINIVKDKIPQLSQMTFPKNKKSIIKLFSQIVRYLLQSNQYTHLSKQFQLQQSVVSALQKSFITDQEIIQLNQIKETIQRFCQGVKLISFPPTGEDLTKVTFSEISDLLGLFKIFSELFVQLFVMSGPQCRNWVLYQNEDKDQLQSVQKNASELLLYTISLLKELNLTNLSQEYMEILLFSTENTQFKNLIVDQIEQIYTVLFNYIPGTMTSEGLCQSMTVILMKIMSFHFENQTTKFDKIGNLFIQIVQEASNSNNEACLENLESIMKWLIYEGYENNIDQVKFIVQEIHEACFGEQNAIENKKIKEMLEEVVSKYGSL